MDNSNAGGDIPVIIQGVNYLFNIGAALLGSLVGAAGVGYFTGGLKGRVEAIEKENSVCKDERRALDERVTTQLKGSDDRVWQIVQRLGDLASKDDIRSLREEMTAQFAALRTHQP